MFSIILSSQLFSEATQDPQNKPLTNNTSILNCDTQVQRLNKKRTYTQSNVYVQWIPEDTALLFQMLVDNELGREEMATRLGKTKNQILSKLQKTRNLLFRIYSSTSRIIDSNNQLTTANDHELFLRYFSLFKNIYTWTIQHQKQGLISDSKVKHYLSFIPNLMIKCNDSDFDFNSLIVEGIDLDNIKDIDFKARFAYITIGKFRKDSTKNKAKAQENSRKKIQTQKLTKTNIQNQIQSKNPQMPCQILPQIDQKVIQQNTNQQVFGISPVTEYEKQMLPFPFYQQNDMIQTYDRNRQVNYDQVPQFPVQYPKLITNFNNFARETIKEEEIDADKFIKRY